MDIMRLLGTRMVFADGGMGTMLQGMGLPGGEFPEEWNFSHPDSVQSVLEAYLAAGCDILTSNTLNANSIAIPGRAAVLMEAGVRIAAAAVKKAGHGYAAADIGPTGKLMRPFGDLPFEEAVSAFGEAAAAGEKAGADLILIETMSDSHEMKAAVLGAKENTRLPVFATMTLRENGKLLTGGDIRGMAAMLEGLGADAIGINCGLGPAQAEPFLTELLACASVPVIITPNAGLPEYRDGKTVFLLDPDAFAEQMYTLAQLGPQIMGGCCGTTPAHMKATLKLCGAMIPGNVIKKNSCVISSRGRSLDINEKPVVIGERINPTGKPRLKQALRDNETEYILREGILQQENGADALDVNVGMPGVDEKTMLGKVVTELQAVSDLPLCIDSADPAALESALRAYNGKALINSVNGRQDSMDAVFPLVKKYGGIVVALLMDENGIPKDAEGRVVIGRRILDRAARYGIAPGDILMDALTMPAGAEPAAPAVTLETLKRAKAELGVRTVLGVSNVSFGLPSRERVSAAFLSMALAAGLNAAILNPGSEAMMSSWRASLALLQKDTSFAGYIKAYSEQKTENTTVTGLYSLRTAVERGLAAEAGREAKKLLETIPPLEVIEKELIPALDGVGQGYEKGEVFLPQLLMSAEAAKEAFAVVKDAMRSSGTQTAKRGRVLLATVQGDVHDIGKNIVKVLLENYGFPVLDLGRDVPPEMIAETVAREGIRLCGLSALMTTTLPNLEKTVALLKRDCPECKIMAGGAVLTGEYALRIGADFYGRDAMSAVRYANASLEMT
jgi:5-methyltetrahydrofolate--homocysteine methyltransferase